MDLFRRQGYHATPVPRLTALLGIGSGSLYAAFGSKDGLYARALERYCDGLVATLDRDMRAGDDLRTALRGCCSPWSRPAPRTRNAGACWSVRWSNARATTTRWSGYARR